MTGFAPGDMACTISAGWAWKMDFTQHIFCSNEIALVLSVKTVGEDLQAIVFMNDKLLYIWCSHLARVR